MRSGTIRLFIASRILILGHLRGMVLLCKCRVILAFYCLVFYCVILACSVCLYFVFIIIFVTEVFERPSGEDLVISFYYCFSPINTLRVFRFETTLRLRENVVSALFRHEIHVECLYGPC